MIPRPKNQDDPIPFFAFLSVVSCTIGLLMFVLAGITVASFWRAEQVVVDDRTRGPGVPAKGRIYVECRPDGLIVHPEKIVVSLDDLDDPGRWVEGPYGRCLTRLVREGRGGSVYFLVRRGGVSVFRKALEYALAAGGGTVDAVARGDALFSVGRQLVAMPGGIQVTRGDRAAPREGSQP